MAWYDDRPVDQESFRRDDPDLGSELSSRIDDFLSVAGALGDMGKEMRRRAAPDDDAGGGTGDHATHSSSSRDARFGEGRMLGEYRVVKEIGRGGMGVVYEAEQISLNRRVALKVLASQLSWSERSVRKFRREAEAGGRQMHPGIVTVYDFGEHDGVYFITQELVEGEGSLADRLERLDGPESLSSEYFRECAALTASTADALSHAHAAGVIHRDVKPSNILLDSEGRPRITDFGLARVEDALSISRTGDLSGTPCYMSPEQADRRRGAVDHRTDVFSLGVTLFEMLTLTLPFTGDTSHQVLREVLFKDPSDPATIVSAIPRDLAVICLKAIEKRPEDRYASMGELAADLKRFLAGEPIRARPVGLGIRLVKRVRRNPVLARLSLVAAAAVLAWVVIGPILLISIVEEKNAKEAALAGKEKRHLTALAAFALDQNPALALLLAIEGWEEPPGLLNRNAVTAALAACHERRTIRDPDVTSAAFSPDGNRVVTASLAGDVKIWDAGSNAPPLVLKGHTRAVTCALFSPDGRWVATASEDMTARLWDATTGEEIRAFLHGRAVNSVSFDAEGKRIVTASSDMTVRVWNPAKESDGRELNRFIGFAWKVNTAVFHPDGRRVVSASDDGMVRIWDCVTGKSRVLHDLTQPVSSAEFSRDGSWLVTVTGERNVQVWDAETNEPCTLFRHVAAVNSAVFSADGTRLVTASKDKIARIFDVIVDPIQKVDGIEPIRLTTEQVAELKGHEGEVAFASFSPNGRQVVTASRDGTVRIWSVRPGRGISSFDTDEGDCHYSFSSDLSRLAVVGKVGPPVITVWDTIRGEPVCTFEEEFLEIHDTIKSITLSSDGKRVAINFSSKNRARIWDVDHCEPAEQSPIEEEAGDIYRTAFSPDGLRTVSPYGENFAILWDLSGNEPKRTALPHPTGARDAEFGPEGESILTLSRDGRTLRLWDAETGSGSPPFPLPDSEVLKKVSLSRDGDRILALTDAGNGLVIDRESRQTTLLPAGGGEFESAELGPDGSTVLTLSAAGEACLWDLDAAGVPVKRRLGGRIERFKRVLFGPCGKRVATASAYGQTGVRDAETGREIASFTSDSPARFAAIAPRHDRRPDGLDWVVILTDDGKVTRWPVGDGVIDLARREKPRELTHRERVTYDLETPADREAQSLAEDLIAAGAGLSSSSRSRLRFRAAPPGLSEAARRIAIEQETSPLILMRESWEAVRLPGSSLASCRTAMAKAEKACLLRQDDGTCRHILGVARFRMADYEGALRALTPLLGRSVHDPEGGFAVPLAFCAMSCAELGRREEALAYLNALRHLMDDRWESRFDVYGALLYEAETRIRIPPIATGHPSRHESGTDGPEPTIPPILFGKVLQAGGPDETDLICDLIVHDPELGRSRIIHPRLERMSHTFFRLDRENRRLLYVQNDSKGISSLMGLSLVDDKDGSERAEPWPEPEPLFRGSPGDDVSATGAVAGCSSFNLGLCNQQRHQSMQPAIYRIDPANDGWSEPRMILGRFDQFFADLAVLPEKGLASFTHYPNKRKIFDRELWISRLRPGDGAIWEPRRVTFDRTSDRFPVFSPDGRHVYWLRIDEDGSTAVCRLDTDSGKRETVFRTDGERFSRIEGQIAVSRNGLIAFNVKGVGDGSILIIDSEGRERFRLPHTTFGEVVRITNPFFLED